MKKAMMAISILVCSFAASGDECTTWGCISTIEELYVTADGLIYVGTPLNEKLANCSPEADKFFSINPAQNANAKEMYSSLLAAFMTKNKIQLRVKEDHAQCELEYVRLDANF